MEMQTCSDMIYPNHTEHKDSRIEGGCSVENEEQRDEKPAATSLFFSAIQTHTENMI